MMTRKHFDALAEALVKSAPATAKGQPYYQWIYTVGKVADVCERFNLAFNRARFLEACNPWRPT